MKVKTSELEGAVLDWVVAQIDPMCNGLEWKKKADGRLFVGFAMIDGVMQPCAYLSNGCCLSEKLGMQKNHVQAYSPSTDWSQCGPLIEKYRITFTGTQYLKGKPRGEYLGATIGFARTISGENAESWAELDHGSAHLIAACRAVVIARLGDEVDVPEGLTT